MLVDLQNQFKTTLFLFHSDIFTNSSLFYFVYICIYIHFELVIAFLARYFCLAFRFYNLRFQTISLPFTPRLQRTNNQQLFKTKTSTTLLYPIDLLRRRIFHRVKFQQACKQMGLERRNEISKTPPLETSCAPTLSVLSLLITKSN